jgi:hypothetical protein
MRTAQRLSKVTRSSKRSVFAIPTTALSLLLAIFFTESSTVITAQSAVECVVGMTDADVDGSHGLTVTEYESMLRNFSVAYHNGCSVPIDPTILLSQFEEVSCLCQNFTVVSNSTVAVPDCVCSSLGQGATVAIPGIYSSSYTTTICSRITNLLTELCAGTTPAPQAPQAVPTTAPIAAVNESGGGSENTKPADPSAVQVPVEADNGGSNSSTVAIVVVVLVLALTAGIAGIFVYKRRKRETLVAAEQGCEEDLKPGASRSGSLPSNPRRAGPRDMSMDASETDTTEAMEEGLDVMVMEQAKAAPPDPLESALHDDTDESPHNSQETESWEWQDSLEVISAAERQSMADALADNGEDYDGDRGGSVNVDNGDHRGPVDVDDGGGVQIPASSSPTRTITTVRTSPKREKLKNKVDVPKVKSPSRTHRSVQRVRAAYMKKARSRRKTGLQPIPESTLTEASLTSI